MFKIYNQKLAGFLMLHGFPLKGIEPNDRISEYNTFLFDSSRAVSAAIDEYQLYKKSIEEGANTH